MRFFFYGTLLDADVRTLVLGRREGRRPVEPATLPGYRRMRMHRRHYPVIVPDPPAAVAGFLIRGLDRRAMALLDEFESDEYDRVRLDVVTAGGKPIAAWVYVAGSRAVPSTEPWDLEAWQKSHKREFRRRMG